jgi:hypothetical protein
MGGLTKRLNAAALPHAAAEGTAMVEACSQ